MNKLVITTPEELKALITECLTEKTNESQPVPLPEAPKFLYSLIELANFLNCSTVTAQKIKNSGRIRYKQAGRKVIFNTLEVLEDLSKTKKRA